MLTHQATPHKLMQTATLSFTFPTPHTHSHTHTAGWPACRWPRLSHTLPSCLCGTWEPLWSQASHTSVFNDSEAACTKEVCPIAQRLSDQPPLWAPLTTHARTHPGKQGCQQRFQAHHLDGLYAIVGRSSAGDVYRENWRGWNRDRKLNKKNRECVCGGWETFWIGWWTFFKNLWIKRCKTLTLFDTKSLRNWEKSENHFTFSACCNRKGIILY